MVAEKEHDPQILDQMQSNQQKAKSLVIQKTTREVPDGITITRRSRPSVDSINPEVDESTALFNRVMDKINIRVLQYPIMFPSIQLMIDRHPEL